MTGNDLSRFVAEIRDTNLLGGSGMRNLNVKFGDAIDQDEKDSSWLEEAASGIGVMKEIEWDIELSDSPSLEEIIETLASEQRGVYRAAIGLGMPIDNVLRPITREDSPENEIDYFPDGLSIEVGPVECYSLESEQPLRMGWIELGLSGYGYLFPWTLRDLVERLEGSEEIGRLTDVCRRFWPVPSEPPRPGIAEIREQFKELWPYDEFDKPWDWFWGLQESG